MGNQGLLPKSEDSLLSVLPQVVEKRNKVLPSTSCTLTIVQVNDVYEVDMWPYYATCKNLEKNKITDCVIGVLPGDFLAPSLLSSLDKGYGMVDCMALAGIEYVCLGNHENDVGLTHLHDRIRQSKGKFQWINSNMQSMPLPNDIESLPEYVILDITGGGQHRRVALLGLNTDDPSVHIPGAFGGCTIEPLKSKAQELYQIIMDKENVDLIIPLTHQEIKDDRELASCGLFPLIIGGHDHDPYLEEINGNKIIKSGMDGKLISISTINWSDAMITKPTIQIEMKNAHDFIPDPTVTAAVIEHKKILEELQRSSLCQIPPDLDLSSERMRFKPTTIGTFLCNAVRDALHTECCMIAGGNIRGNRSYAHETSFTYAHLKSELPFKSEIVIVNLPGQIICDMITYTRGFALRTPPVENGGYLQTDDSIVWDSTSNTVYKIANQTVDLQRIYTVGLNLLMLHGLDEVLPLLQYKNSHLDDPSLNRLEDSGIPIKEIIVAHFSNLLLYQIIQSEKFEDIDTDHDGLISREEFLTLANKKFKSELSPMVINNLFSIADIDNDGTISAKELTQVYMSAMAILMVKSKERGSLTSKDEISIDEVVQILKVELGDIVDENSLREEVKRLDEDNSGFITIEEFSKFRKMNAVAVVHEVVI